MHRAGTQRRHAHAHRLELAIERLAERDHIGLAGVIDRRRRPREKARDRRDIENAATMALYAIHESERQVGQRAHVEIDHAEQFVAVAVGGIAVQAEAGVVDDVLRLQIAHFERQSDPRHGVVFRKIDRKDQRYFRASRFKLGSERLEPRLAPRHQNERMPVPGKRASELGADTRRSSGDDGNGSHRGGVARQRTASIRPHAEEPPRRRLEASRPPSFETPSLRSGSSG